MDGNNVVTYMMQGSNHNDARKQLNDGVAIFSHIYDEWKAASRKQ